MNDIGQMPQHILFKDLPNAKDEQFLMRRLSVYNWGTFSSVHTCNFAEDGSLILGPSGAGKSTLLDAISAMIVPPQKVRFNAAADEGGQGRPDRTLKSYIRGAWANKGNRETRDSVKQVLRDGATTSAIALEFGNRLGRVITLVRVFWITGASTTSDVNHAYLVAEGSFDLKVLAKLEGDMRKLRSFVENMEGVTPHPTFAHYIDHWCRIMGVEDHTALDLLHKTQSTKSVGDLNSFLRDFMLEEPETFAKAQAFVTDFVELKEAHEAVVSARKQIDILRPARTAFAHYGELNQQIELKRALRQATLVFVAHIRIGLLETEIGRVSRELEATQSQVEANKSSVTQLNDRLFDLMQQYATAGGADIRTIEHRIEELIGQRGERSGNKDQVQVACRSLGWTMPQDAETYAELVMQARALIDETETREKSRREEEVDLRSAQKTLDAEMKAIREELAALEESPSNITKALRAVRDAMCREEGIPVAKVVFVGELMQVREEAREWRPAIEKLLGGFGKGMIVHPDYHRKVAQWINRNNTGLRVVYHAVDPTVSVTKRVAKSEDSVILKLELKDHPFSGWVYRELLERFDFECVPNAIALTKGDHRMTIEGQIRHGKGRTEKDDRYNFKDPKNWTLGFDNREKLEAYKQAAYEKGLEIAQNMEKSQSLSTEQQQDMVAMASAKVLIQFNWISVDVASLIEEIQLKESTRDRLKAGNSTLVDLDGQISQVREKLDGLSKVQTGLVFQVNTWKGKLDDHEKELQTSRVEAGALPGTHRDALRTRFPEDWRPSLKSIDLEVQQLAGALSDEIVAHGDAAADCKQQAISAFATILRDWKEEAGDVQANLESAPDFFARLTRLEEDGLPQHETKFQELLNQLSTQRLAELQTHMESGRSQINQRLEDVNEQLYTVSYNPGTYIRILQLDLRHKEVEEFRGILTPIFANQHLAKNDKALAEEQYERLLKVVLFLSDDDAEARRKRHLVLDIRQHIEFVGEELHRGTDEQVDYYDGSSSRSGGQRQKLTAMCLAAALRYKLGGVDGGVPQYAAVVLDEAFTKTDPEFTRICLKIFKELGFQLIVATPMKGVQTIEEFIGGAMYVSIEDRKKSSVCQIDYIESDQRLNLSDQQRVEALESEDD